MKFSIIVAYYQASNGKKDINRLLDSLRKQSFDDFEVLMVHDGKELIKPVYDTTGKEVWKDGWYDKSEDSDGKIFPELARKYKTQQVPFIIGDHY
jgi:hypothetical protein